MGLFSDQKSWGKFPKERGEPITITIKDCQKVECDFASSGLKYNPNFLGKSGKDFGYHYEITDESGRVFIVKAWALFFAIQNSGAEIGDTIRVDHPGKGEYIVTIVSKGGEKSVFEEGSDLDVIAEDW